MSGPTSSEIDGWHIVDGVLHGADARVGAWVASRLDQEVIDVPFSAFGILPEAIVKDDLTLENLPTKLIGGAYFFNHHAGPDQYDITIAVAVDDIGAGRIPVVQKILEFPFGTLDLPRVSAEICMSNTRAIKQAENVGFVLEGVKKHSAADGHEIGMFGLYRETCKYWQRKNEAA